MGRHVRLQPRNCQCVGGYLFVHLVCVSCSACNVPAVFTGSFYCLSYDARQSW